MQHACTVQHNAAAAAASVGHINQLLDHRPPASSLPPRTHAGAHIFDTAAPKPSDP